MADANETLLQHRSQANEGERELAREAELARAQIDSGSWDLLAVCDGLFRLARTVAAANERAFEAVRAAGDVRQELDLARSRERVVLRVLARRTDERRRLDDKLDQQSLEEAHRSIARGERE